MGIARGPNTVKDGLVFGCDTGYGVADNSTATRFYPGESTINLIPSSAATGTGNFSRSSHHNEGFTYSNVTNYRGRANVHRLYINPSGNTAAPYADYGGQYYKSGGSVVGDVYAISFDFYVAKGNNSPSLSTAYANGYKSPTNAGAASITANSDVDLENGWTRRTRIATITIAGNTHWRFGLNTGGNETEAYLDNVQIELKSHATPFIDGTRSSTASLIDLKRTTNIDVSNVSFDSTGQPTFDNTDDRITMPNSSVFNHTSELSIEAWVKFDGNSNDFIFEKGNVNTQYSLFSHGSDIVFRTYHAGDSGYQTLSPSKTTAGITNGQWHHIVGSWDGSTKRIYVDGVDKASVSKSGALTTTSNGAAIGSFGGTSSGYYFGGDIAIVKIYDKGLSATEVKQNYNSQKNRFDI